MNRRLNKSPWTFQRAATLGGALTALACQAALGQTITNPSFETDTFATAPGFVSVNKAITGWTADPTDQVGLNPAGGKNPFANNGIIPDGKNVAFIQSGGDVNSAAQTTLSTTISGLTVGATYHVTFRANASSGQNTPLRVWIDSTEMLALGIWPAGAANIPYTHLAFDFTAASASQTLSLVNDSASSVVGTNTVMVDNFQIAPANGSWAVGPWNDDSDIGVDQTFYYTHAYAFNTSASFVVNGVTFTGIPGGSPKAAGRFSTAHLPATYGVDNSTAVDATSTGYPLAQDFVYGGSLPVGNSESITITGLTPGTKYVATIYSTAFEMASDATITGQSRNRWLSLNAGADWLTVNQDAYDTDGARHGIRYTYTYTADSSGSVTLQIFPVNNANQTGHVNGFSNRQAVSGNVGPIIISQPQAAVVSQNVPATFTAMALGLPIPTYQWRLNGANISGAQSSAYTVAGTSLTAGNYDVVAANSAGSVTSSVAKLTVGMALTNPSFETDTGWAYPGYASASGGNGLITGWNLSNPGGAGINPAGSSPFADNGVIPNGSQICFIQASGDTLSQVVSGFTVGSAYVVHYYENARTGTGVPSIQVLIGGATVVAAHAINPVGGANSYYEVYSDVFIATNASLELDFLKDSPTGGDTTALIDNVTILPLAAGAAPFVTPTGNPQSLLVTVGDTATFTGQGVGALPLSYQWLFNGAPLAGANLPTLKLVSVQKPSDGNYSLVISNSAGSVTTAVARLTVYQPIPGLFATGVDDKGVILAAGAQDTHYQLVVNPDTGPGAAVVESPLGSGWMADSATSQWVGPQEDTTSSAAGEYVYRTILNLTGRDPSTLVIQGQWSTPAYGTDIRINGLSTGNPESLSPGYFTAFTIYGTNALNWVAGTNTLDFVASTALVGPAGFRVEYQLSNILIPPGVPPTITTQPLGETAVVGDTVTFTAAAAGSAPLSFQWEKNGAAISGQTTATLVLANVQATDSGLYSLLVSNASGSTNSVAALLNVAYQPVSGVVFGTGVAADGTLLAPATVDPHYTIVYSDDPNFPGPDALVVNHAWPVQAGVWVPDGPNSSWIAPEANQGTGDGAGLFTFETKINLTGYDVSKVLLSGAWGVDNYVTNLTINGVSTGVTDMSAGFAALVPYTLTATNGLVAGTNTLDFYVVNASAGPIGFRTDLRLLVPVPPSRPALQVAHNGAAVTITWSADASHKLQSATSPSGPWTVITGATSPYATTATGARMFYSLAP